jgi:PAS domain S-box-containing protein
MKNSPTDIPEQIRTLEQARESELELRSIVLEAPIGICILDAATLVSEIVNDSFTEVAGKPYEAIFGRFYWDTFAEARPYYEAALNQVVEEGITYYANEVELMLIRHGREEIVYVTFVYAPLKDAAGKVKKVAIWVLENTTQVVARRRIEEAERKARLAIDSAKLGVYEVVLATNTITTDARFKEIWGVDSHSLSRQEYRMGFHPDDLRQAEAAYELSLQSGQLNYQARVVWKDGSIHWVSVTGALTYDQQGSPAKLVGVAQDITDAVFVKQKIEESEKSIRTMILQAPVAMCIFRGQSYVVEIANRKMIELWGKKPLEVLGKPIFEGLPEAKNQGLEALLHHVFETGETFKADERPVKLPRNGRMETVYVNFVYEALDMGDESRRDILAVAIDVTAQVIARIKIEEVVAERTKTLKEVNISLKRSNDDLAQFAYIASHDLQEPIRKISTYMQMLQKSIPSPDEKQVGYFNKISAASKRMRTLILDVLAISELSKEKPGYEKVDLQKIAAAVLLDFDLLIEQGGARIQCSGLPVVDAIPLQMTQLFTNLISNALKFTRPGVKPIITIRSEPLTAEEFSRYLFAQSNTDYYQLIFSDNGIGFQAEQAEQIFNIFQRLHDKTEYSGTGIGLALCKKIAQSHHGEIFASGSPGNGAVFTVIIPAQQPLAT